MINANIAALLYLVAGILFILALRGLSSPASSRRGNLFGMIGMGIAVIATVLGPRVTPAGYAWIAQELVEGPSVQQLIDIENGPLPLDAALAIGVQLGRALEALSLADIVHRDISPSNIVVSATGVAKLCDFGASFEAGMPERLSQGSVPAGTVDFPTTTTSSSA